MQNIFIYIDDSGVFHRKHKYFVYGGYLFLSKDDKNSAKREYKAVLKAISRSLGRTDELKSFGLDTKHKRALFNVLQSYESFSVDVNIANIYETILSDTKSIHRYKDYALKRAIKGKIQSLIMSEDINAYEDVQFHIFIDEQGTASNGLYDLEESIKEEFQNGVHNFDYGTFHSPVFKSKVSVEVTYCDSKCHELIQASDILANRIYCSYVLRNHKLRNINKHYQLHLP